MSSGKIQFAEQGFAFVLKFTGDVRLNLCTSLNETIQQIINTHNFKSIIIDLTETDSIDSTTLGLLAKLSILSKVKFGYLPTLVSLNPDINRLLDSMGFYQVFNIVHTNGPCVNCLDDLPEQNQSEEDVKKRVLEAHKILMSLNDSNQEAFKDLVSALEKHDPA
ncbi:anti-sigma factor antagonist RssC [Pseudomonas sp. F1_0610]|uniref:anti-sigma factor antagonist RssC n=1 Tax=Pseudomonas sp. F1_0610 TaxID=3114284 RepID=UPI0039C222AA